MGVSLERVQYKFASIIGELCSEPFVLSQFAVWLDLRLAEYKSKGSISLDCCGFLPEPDWLKGLREPQSQSDLSTSTSVGDVPTGDLGESFFFLSKESTNQDFSDGQNSYERGHSVNHQTLDEPSGHEEIHQSKTSIYVIPDDMDVVVVDEEDDAVSFNSTQDAAEETIDCERQSDQPQRRQRWEQRGITPHSSLPASNRHFPYHRRLENVNRSSRPGVRETRKRNSTARNIAAAVSSLHRWLRECPRGDSRCVLDIPAAELDNYLAEFFSTVKKPSGYDYTRRSFDVYRYSLDRYLKDNKYPYSICRSSEFARSQQSFQKRKLSLHEVAYTNVRPLTVMPEQNLQFRGDNSRISVNSESASSSTQTNQSTGLSRTESMVGTFRLDACPEPQPTTALNLLSQQEECWQGIQSTTSGQLDSLEKPAKQDIILIQETVNRKTEDDRLVTLSQPMPQDGSGIGNRDNSVRLEPEDLNFKQTIDDI